MSRLWHVNPDAMMVRQPSDTHEQKLTDAEARTSAANQYLAGGMVKLTFLFAGLDDYTRSLYRHIISPSFFRPGDKFQFKRVQYAPCSFAA